MNDYSSLGSLENTKSLVIKVRDLIEEAILDGRIKPKDRLVEKELSKTFRVSRGPIREAFRLLEMEGYIECFPRKGAVVVNISQKDFEDIYQVRTVLEGLSAKLFCQRADEKEINALKNIYKKMETTLIRKDIDNYTKLNREFHSIFVTGSKNEKILSSYNQYIKQIIWFQNNTLAFVDRPEISHKEHKMILDAFIERDEKKAEMRARSHVEHSLSLYRECQIS